MAQQYPVKFNYGDKILDAAANGNDVIRITSTINGNTVAFKPLIKSFNDTHTAAFQAESVFGRMDDLMSYQSTKRAINIAFDVPSYSEEEARDNLLKVSLLKTWLYPSYNNPKNNNALTIKKAPLFRIKYMNFITGLGGKPLLGTLDGCSFAPDLGEGSYVSNGIVVPKTFSINLNFKVLHEFKPENGMTKYPYLLNAEDKEFTTERSGIPQKDKK